MEQPRRIVWYYGGCTKPILPLHDIQFIEGVPTEEQVSMFDHDVIVLDDLMNEAHKNTTLFSNLFTKTAHHQNCLIIFITQNLFATARTQSINAHFLVLFQSVRDRLQISYLARQMYPRNSNFLIDAVIDATQQPHGYLFLDMRATTPDEVRVRADIFNDKQSVVYQPE